MKRDKLIDLINKTLEVELPDKDPYLFTGLQVTGKEDIKKIAIGVSANLEFFKKATQWGADMIILHHGMFGPKKNTPITKVIKNRLKILFNHDVTLLGYHYFLDKHPTLGNNAQIIKLLDAKMGKEFGILEGVTWGYEAVFSKPITIGELIRRSKRLCGSSVKVFKYGPKMIKRIAVLSGGGPYLLPEAIDKKLDAYLTGEARESTEALAKEAGIHFFSLGHYNCEKFGILALGKFLAKKFPSLQIKFIDIPNLL